MKRLLILVLYCLATGGLRAQSYYFRHYQVEQGLSNNTVFSCQQDKRGFLWLGTKDGLNRFDGYSFKVFRNDPDDSTSIGDNFIRSVFISKGDTLYAGTRIGLYRYNARLENFQQLYRTPEEVRDIKRDQRGRIWFVAGQTLYRLDEATGATRVYDGAHYFSATSVCVDITGTVWVSTADGTLKQYSDVNDQFISYPLFDKGIAPPLRWIEKIYATAGPLILAGTSNFGVKAFNINDHSWKDLLTYNPDRTAIFARDFVEAPDHRVWIATESGIFIYNIADGSVNNLRKQQGNPFTLSDNAVYSLCRDREGGTWAGTYFGGINYYPQEAISFEKYFPGDETHPLSGYAVREICEDQQGHLWVGTEDAGLNRMDKKTGEVVRFQPNGKPGSIAYPNIHGMLVKGNELWIGTFEHGLDIMDIRSGKVIRHYPGDSAQLKSNFIVVLHRTREGKIFVGTRHGLYLFDSLANDFRLVEEVPAESFIHAIMEDTRGRVWVGTLGNGLYFLRPGTTQGGHFIYRPQDKKSLSNNSVITLFQSGNGQLWIGTEGGGLCRFNEADSSFVTYTSRQGFPSNTIFRILEDDEKQLWITTANGLVCFQPVTGQIKIYTTAHGLLSNQFNYNSGYRDSEGRMYFGSAKGLISFDPTKFRVNDHPLPVYITGLYLNDRELRPGQEGSPLANAISFTDQVELKHDQGSFSIDFAALSFAAPEMTEYMYKTEGLDDDWTYLKTNRKVYFTNLAPGTYRFRVKAGSADGGWLEPSSDLVIRILPPFWASNWAYALYAFLGLAAVLLVIRFYHNRVKEKTKQQIETLEHEKEKEIYQAKIDFFTNVAHEIKTPLTLVKAPMEQIAKMAGPDAAFAYDLRIMQRNTDRLVELTNQLLDFRKVEARSFYLNFVPTNINDLLGELYSSFKLLADQRRISFELTLPAVQVIAPIDTDSFQKIINNLLYNAVNYCGSKVMITLSMLAVTNQFSVEVRNDGLLIPEELKEKIFEPFYRLSHHRDKAGSGIGLALSRSLAELHKGNIIFSVKDGMNVFELLLPLDQQATKPDRI